MTEMHAISLINNVSFAKGAVLVPSGEDVKDIEVLMKDLGLTSHESVLRLLYGPLPNSTKANPSYKALYKKLESIPVHRMSDESQTGGRS